ncbi:GFA family protein [Pleionea sp. CnH1-48]|uniref:GFA family protein n=1 Tax=Pleionea sp. CnH1-48 TaxID=2954494 RepID=UPI002096CB1A|nr:GFA family protein [Pleionea sp. CnH1-48]MCO7223532.1 GFA family protein [Pleionea sp. CnH1-48]
MEYSGRCHCGAVTFTFQLPNIDAGLQCNCSICIRKNAIMSAHYVEPDQFNLLSGKDALTNYQWGDKDVNHYFCKHCGIYPFHDTTYDPGKYRINLGCVEGLSPRSLKLTQFDGRNQL